MFIFTHDSIGLGEDGPTHQPIEQLAGLRAMPNMMVLRPGDANEVVESYKVMVQSRHTPSTLVLTRQAMPTLTARNLRRLPVWPRAPTFRSTQKVASPT